MGRGGEQPVVAARDTDDGRRVGRAQPGGAGLDVQRQSVHLVLVQDQRRVLEVVGHLGDVLDLVRHLLEVAHLPDHVGDLEEETAITGINWTPIITREEAAPVLRPSRQSTHHPHLGEIEQSVMGEVGRALLDEGEVGEVHAEVGDARWVAAVQRLAQVAEAAV